MKPSELKIGIHIVTFAIKTIGFLLILNKRLFHVLALLGIHLRPFEPLGLTLGFPWAPFGHILGPLGLPWAPLGVPRGSLGLFLGPSWRTLTFLWAHLGAPRIHLAPSEAF